VKTRPSLKSTGLCSCPKGLSVTITTAIQTYGIWLLPQNFRVYAEFREIPRKHGNSTATAKFRGSARNSAARGKLWALIITERRGRSGTVGGRSPRCFFWVIPKRSIPKPDRCRKDIIQQESLGTDAFNIGIEEQQLCKISQ